MLLRKLFSYLFFIAFYFKVEIILFRMLYFLILNNAPLM